MKLLVKLLTANFLITMSFANLANAKIINWEPTLPVTQEQVLDVIHIKADESLYSNNPKAVKCSSEYDDPELVSYYTYLDENEQVVHKIKVELVMAEYIGRCQKQAIYICSAPFTVYSDQTYSLDNWNCRLMYIKNQ